MSDEKRDQFARNKLNLANDRTYISANTSRRDRDGEAVNRDCPLPVGDIPPCNSSIPLGQINTAPANCEGFDVTCKVSGVISYFGFYRYLGYGRHQGRRTCARFPMWCETRDSVIGQTMGSCIIRAFVVGSVHDLSWRAGGISLRLPQQSAMSYGIHLRHGKR